MPKANKWGEDGRGSGAPGAGPGGRRRGGGSPFWPLSAAYQESERKAHRQKSSSVRKVPLRSLISPGARRATAGPRPHGPGGTGAGARGPGGGGGPGPGARRSCGPGRDGYGQGGNGDGGGGMRAGCSSAAHGAGGLDLRLGRGRAGLGQGGKSRGPAGSGTAAESTVEGRGGRDLKGPHHSLPLGAPPRGGVGGQLPGSQRSHLRIVAHAWNSAPQESRGYSGGEEGSAIVQQGQTAETACPLKSPFGKIP